MEAHGLEGGGDGVRGLFGGGCQLFRRFGEARQVLALEQRDEAVLELLELVLDSGLCVGLGIGQYDFLKTSCLFDERKKTLIYRSGRGRRRPLGAVADVLHAVPERARERGGHCPRRELLVRLARHLCIRGDGLF